MTKQEAIDYITSKLAAPITLAQNLIDSFLKVLDFSSQSAVDDVIPDWDDAITFQTDGSDGGKYCLHPDDNGKKRIFETKIDDNLNNEPPTDPEVTENASWEEISQSSGSGISEWAAGVYGSGLVIVFHNHSTDGRGLYMLLDPARPYASTDIEAEITAGDWELIAVSKEYVDAQASAGVNIDTSSRIFEDFYGAVNYFALSAINNGGGLAANPGTSSYGLDATEQAIGVMLMSTGSSTAGASALANSTYNLTFGFGYTLTLTWRVALKDLSDGTDTFVVRHGFTNSNNGTSTNGAYFRYTHSVNSGKWEAVTVVAGTETAEDTGITGAVDGFHLFKIVVNDDATQVDFYIDGVLTNSITTNIPNGSAEVTGYSCHIEKTAGSTAKGVYADYFELIATRTTAR